MLAAAISNKTLYGGNVGRPSFKGMLLKKYLIMALNPATVWLLKMSIIIDRSVLRGKASPLSPVYSGHSIAVHKARLLYEYFRPTPQG